MKGLLSHLPESLLGFQETTGDTEALWVSLHANYGREGLWRNRFLPDHPRMEV